MRYRGAWRQLGDSSEETRCRHVKRRYANSKKETEKEKNMRRSSHILPEAVGRVKGNAEGLQLDVAHADDDGELMEAPKESGF